MNRAYSRNIQMLIKVAQHLDWLLEDIVFVGGAVAELLFSNPSLVKVRMTKDVDIIISIVTRKEYYKLENELRKRNCFQRMQESDPICRWIIENTIVDIMPLNSEILGFSNPWYPAAL